jgi:hypothetical protein
LSAEAHNIKLQPGLNTILAIPVDLLYDHSTCSPSALKDREQGWKINPEREPRAGFPTSN